MEENSLSLVEKFISGVVDTGEQFIVGVVDTGEQLSPVFSPVSLILVRSNQKAKNLSPYKAENTYKVTGFLGIIIPHTNSYQKH
jgi:hypothetical protein